MNNLSRASFISSPVPLLWVFCMLGFVPSAGFHSQLQAQISAQMQTFPTEKTVVDMTAEELLQCYPSELRHLEFSPNQDPLNSLLAKTGQRVQDFFRDFSDTSSKEFVLLQKLGYNGNVEHSDSRDFSYMMLYHPSENRPLVEEYRTDKRNRPITQDAIRGFFITSGYAGLSLYFHPNYQQGLRFRYLGRQTAGSRAHIIAFAQKLETKDLTIVFTDTDSGESARLPVQGIAWVDPDTYQILRLRINLQAAGNRSFLTAQTTDIQFSEARFADAQRQLWMPREVMVISTIAGNVFRNYHRYSDYKLFATSSDFTIEKPKPRH